MAKETEKDTVPTEPHIELYKKVPWHELYKYQKWAYSLLYILCFALMIGAFVWMVSCTGQQRYDTRYICTVNEEEIYAENAYATNGFIKLTIDDTNTMYVQEDLITCESYEVERD